MSMFAAARRDPATVALEQALDRDGLAVIPGALERERLGRLCELHRALERQEVAAGRAGADASVHLLGFVSRHEEFLELLDLPPAFALVARVLGWNIHMHHCHLDAHPPVRSPRPRWTWHQDGGRQNLELLDCTPRPRLSLKVAFFLSDVHEPGMGNMLVIPGSHRADTLARPASPADAAAQPERAEPVLARAGDAIVFDRRLWHARSPNTGTTTRRALFLAYTYRWVRPRDAMAVHPAWWRRLSPVRRQLLGAGTSAIGHWIPADDDVPLRAAMERAGLLDPAIPSHR